METKRAGLGCTPTETWIVSETSRAHHPGLPAARPPCPGRIAPSPSPQTPWARLRAPTESSLSSHASLKLSGLIINSTALLHPAHGSVGGDATIDLGGPSTWPSLKPCAPLYGAAGTTWAKSSNAAPDTEANVLNESESVCTSCKRFCARSWNC